MNYEQINKKNRIFCNRNLNMNNITAIGLDMDYTLSLYRPETFECLAYSETLKKLVQLGYPSCILNWIFDWKYMIRGLIIDKARGNILKLDRHRYVKVAYHGFKELCRDERRYLYDASQILNYEEPAFALIDTLFSLAEAYLFCQLVEYKDEHENEIQQNYATIYKDVRYSIDLCHKDGSIKNKVAQNPSLYIDRDTHLVETLQTFKFMGKKLFIATNSLWEYTNVVMNYLFGNTSGSLNSEWLDMFDMVIVGTAKPSFFVHSNQIFALDHITGLLKNIIELNKEHKLFQGGNFKHLHKYLGIKTGSEILYVGDHIYGDILRSKKELGWRTMLVIEELEKELENKYNNSELENQFNNLTLLRDNLDDELQAIFCEKNNLILQSNINNEFKTQISLLDIKINSLTEDKNKTNDTLQEYLKEYHYRYHKIWGQLMKTGHQNSRFAQQIEGYACLYTGRLTNFRFYSPNTSFYSIKDLMPHEI